MKNQTGKSLRIFQQNELNAIIMYRALAECAECEAESALLLSIAADEGKHAGILRQYTNQILRPKNTMKNMILFSMRTMHKKALFLLLSRSEKTAAKLYEPFFSRYPRTKEIAADELRHGALLEAYAHELQKQPPDGCAAARRDR